MSAPRSSSPQHQGGDVRRAVTRALPSPQPSPGGRGCPPRRIARASVLSAATLAALLGLLGVSAAVNAPVILEPAVDGQIVNFFDVHMVTAPFSPSVAGETHACSDWEIEALASMELVWQAPCATGASSVHIHLGDGEFRGSHAVGHQLLPDTDYRLRARFHVRSAGGGMEASAWAERTFHTSKASLIQPLLLSDVARIPRPAWSDDRGSPIVLPDGSVTLRLEAQGVGLVLELGGRDGESNRVVNPEGLPGHGPLRVVLESRRSAPTAFPPSQIRFADGGGADRTIYLPQIDLQAGGSLSFWIAENGGSFLGDAATDAAASAPSFATLSRESPVPWSVRQPGYDVALVATEFQLPVNLAFVPRLGAEPSVPLFYVTELYGAIKVVTRSGEVRDFARGLLNFDPVASFPGSGERGLTGIVVEPHTGDVFASLVYESPPGSGIHFPRVIRLASTDGGLTASTQTTVLDMPYDPVGPSHQISNLSIGPEGNLYVHVGDGFDIGVPQNLAFFRGKILRLRLDGSAPPDNPFFSAADGIGAADYVFAYGFRNPFGGAWRASDGSHYEVENGPFVDRFARVVAGRNYLWDGSDASMYNYAIYNWTAANSPVNLAFVEPETFGGSGFPSEKMGHAFVTESGPTYALGPQVNGKRISEFVLDEEGALVGGPVPLVEYNGAGRASAVGLAAGPGGLYFSDLYRDVGASFPFDRGASILRVRYVGTAGFSAESAEGPAPLTVRFQDASRVPPPVSWRWEFGDGATSTERDPVHVFVEPGTYDVRLTVTLTDGEAVHQKNEFVVVRPGTQDGAPHPLPAPCAGRQVSQEAPDAGVPTRPCSPERLPQSP